ncbi:hypothetical protein KFK09_008646 [Dendrobium nobile]|uniref:Uncharacterized protein n=1 Tax=Dendrobium nobile TaxID=94219 RepID=A0A8T3BNM4_DENNO|nr:hypothetical protein KFK09_008646 [Dendrobium nobile]
MESLSDVEEELLRRRSVRWFPSAEMLLSQASVAAEEAEEKQRTLALALTAKAKVELGLKRMNCEEAIHVLRTSISGLRSKKVDEQKIKLGRGDTDYTAPGKGKGEIIWWPM